MGLSAELKRRNVYRAAVAYLVVAWLLLQVADIVLGTFEAPPWVQQSVLIILLLGFPLALVLAWIYELTPEGIKVDDGQPPANSTPAPTRGLTNNLIIALLAAAVMFLLIDELWIERTQAPASASDLTSIAVLPFDNRSAMPDDEAFVEGVHDDILTRLGAIASLSVISRTSVGRFADSELPIQEIAAALGAEAILEGSVQRAGEEVRINVKLIDATRDAQLWSRNYDRELTARNVFDIQSEISAAVANSLSLALTTDEAGRIELRPTENLEAYEELLLGRRSLDVVSGQSLREAAAHFESAIALDSEFAEAYVGLAETLRQQFQYGERSDATLIEKARENLATAFSLRTDVAEAYAVRAAIKHDFNDLDGMQQDLDRTLDLNPNLVQGHILRADLLALHLGREEEGLAEIERAIELDPLAARPRRMLAMFHLNANRLDDARSVLEELRHIEPDDPLAAATLSLVAAFFGEGRVDDGLEFLLEAVRLDPENPNFPAFMAAVLSDSGEIDLALSWVDYALAIGPNHTEPNDVAMFVHLYHGDQERAYAYAERAFELSPDYPSAIPATVLGFRDAEAGGVEDALARFESAFPELFEQPVTVLRQQYRAAIEVARLHKLVGEDERAQPLLDGAREVISRSDPRGFLGVFFYDVRLRAIEGDYAGALEALERAADNGVVTLWRFHRDHDVALRPLRDQPGYEEIAARFDEELRERQESIGALRARGVDLEPPSLPAKPQ